MSVGSVLLSLCLFFQLHILLHNSYQVSASAAAQAGVKHAQGKHPVCFLKRRKMGGVRGAGGLWVSAEVKAVALTGREKIA